ncbi:MAG: hypothetical protein KJ970_12630 [Candidatus Eisenbacteria bacterium]|uniref:Uncharacterized protein n=1 Tax=Eiseniibacteriota bacterium TaxID=2212470 RepID=A0A948W6Q4_UNCEI|nr:hypothetical protein [Candidatus Eisenbacteria bacterium]
MGDGSSYCGVNQRDVTLTRDFILGKYEVTNQEYLEALQWAYDLGYVIATTTMVLDNLDGSTEELLDIASEYCEIGFDGAGTFLESVIGQVRCSYSKVPLKQVVWFAFVCARCF